MVICTHAHRRDKSNIPNDEQYNILGWPPRFALKLSTDKVLVHLRRDGFQECWTMRSKV